MAASLQHCPPAQQPRLSSAASGSGDTAIASRRFRFAPPPTANGGGDDNALSNNLDHPVGAAQLRTLKDENRRLKKLLAESMLNVGCVAR
jgi:hypothetical protein